MPRPTLLRLALAAALSIGSAAHAQVAAPSPAMPAALVTASNRMDAIAQAACTRCDKLMAAATANFNKLAARNQPARIQLQADRTRAIIEATAARSVASIEQVRRKLHAQLSSEPDAALRIAQLTLAARAATRDITDHVEASIASLETTAAQFTPPTP